MRAIGDLERRCVCLSVLFRRPHFAKTQQKRFFDGFRSVFDGFCANLVCDSLDESRVGPLFGRAAAD